MQEIQLERTTISVRGMSIPVYVFAVEGAVPGPADLLFLHGYARDPRDYGDLLRTVAEAGHRVVAPFLFGNGGLSSPPLQFWSCAALAQRTLEAMGESGMIHAGAPIFGHSTGGAVAFALGRVEPKPRALIAFNPVQPASGAPCAFMLRSAWMNTKMALGLAGSGRAARRVLLQTGGRFYANWFRGPVANFRLIGGLRAYNYLALKRWHGTRCSVPVTVIYGHGDEFYSSGAGLQGGLESVFAHLSVLERADQNSHEWPLFRPDEAAAMLMAAIAQGPS